MKLVRTTVKTNAQAQKIVSMLLKAGAACISYWKIKSTYTWNGKKVDENEYALEAKCDNGRAKKIVKMLEKTHPYDTPMILVLRVSKINKKYRRWLRKQ